MKLLSKSLLGWIMGARCAALALALLICAAPLAHAVYHGPSVMVAEAQHVAHHHDHGHDVAGHHNAGDHDHIVTDIIFLATYEINIPALGAARPASIVGAGVQARQLRRPPRYPLA